ncbi:MAG: hypothetical protein IJ514_07715 [Clostridia bacterium]|nr:hypothetical protein [Clostridia bacterium]
MKQKWKDKIIDAYKSETPDNRERILSACENETQYSVCPDERKTRKLPVFFRRAVSFVACLVLFGLGLFVGQIIPETQPVATAETCVYLDVNPSLELALDKNDTVLSCTPANTDAETLLNGMKLEGLELKTALNAIVGAMYVNGYLSSEDNSMLISVDTTNENNTSDFLSYITNQVNEVFVNSEMECAIIAQAVKADEALKQRAEEQGISVGKMYLLDKMIGSMELITEEDIAELANMSIKDLNLMYSAKPDDEEEKPSDELISGSVNVKVGTEDALSAVLTELGKTEDEVEEARIFILPSKRGETKVVYSVTVKFYNDKEIYKYEVDYQTGELERLDEEDGFPSHGSERQQPGNGFDD